MKKILLISAVAALAMTSCGDKKTAETYDFAGKTLQLVELNGEAYSVESTTRAAELTFGADGQLAGSTGCNLINGTYYANEDTLRFPQPLAMTRMMCDEVSNAVEMGMAELLSNANLYAVDEDHISIFNGETLLGVFAVVEKKACCKGEGEEHACQGHGEGEAHECNKTCEKKQEAAKQEVAVEEAPEVKDVIEANKKELAVDENAQAVVTRRPGSLRDKVETAKAAETTTAQPISAVKPTTQLKVEDAPKVERTTDAPKFQQVKRAN